MTVSYIAYFDRIEREIGNGETEKLGCYHKQILLEWRTNQRG